MEESSYRISALESKSISMLQSSQMLSLALGWLSRYIHPDIASFTYSELSNLFFTIFM